MASALDRQDSKVKLSISRRKKKTFQQSFHHLSTLATSRWIQRAMEGELKRLSERTQGIQPRGNTSKTFPEKESEPINAKVRSTGLDLVVHSPGNGKGGWKMWGTRSGETVI